MKFKIKFRYFGGWHSPTKKQYGKIKMTLEDHIPEGVLGSIEKGKPVAMRESVLGFDYWLKVVEWY